MRALQRAPIARPLVAHRGLCTQRLLTTHSSPAAAAIATAVSSAIYSATQSTACAAAPETTPAETATLAATVTTTGDSKEAEATSETGPAEDKEVVKELIDPKKALDTKPEGGLGSALWYIWSLVDKGLVLIGCLFAIASVYTGVLVPLRSAVLLKAATAGGITMKEVLGVLGVANAQALFRVASSACLIRAADRLKLRLREHAFGAVLAQELEWVHGKRPAALIAAITSDTEEAGRAVSVLLANTLGSVTRVIGALISLFQISPQLTGLTLLLAPPIATLGAVSAAYERRMRKRSRAASDAAVAGASEIVEKLATVQAYAQEEREGVRYAGLLASEERLTYRVLMFHKGWTTALQLLTSTFTALALAVAGKLAAAGRFDPTMLLPFQRLAMDIGGGIGAMIYLSGDAAKLGDAIRRLKEVSEGIPCLCRGGSTHIIPLRPRSSSCALSPVACVLH